jgi:cell division protease FtsH
MVTYYGMSDEVGHLSFYDSTGARGYDLTKPYSEKTAELIDKEVKDLIQMIHDRTLKILTDNKEGFLALATVLLEKEVIFAEDLENIFGPRAGAQKENVSVSDEQNVGDGVETPETEDVAETAN